MPDGSSGLTNLYINGRFLTHRQSGVQRFAREVVRSIDALLDEPRYSRLRERAVLVTPSSVPTPSWLNNLRHVRIGMFRGGYAWEQFDLSISALRGVLLNLCNLGPVLRRRQVVVVHDATIKAQPEGFSRAFRAAYAILLPVLIRRAARVLTVSDFSRGEISRWYGIPMSRISVCHEGAEHILAQTADASVLIRNGLAKDRYFLAVGLGAANKNLELLLRAFSLARLEGVKLVLTGNRNSRVHGLPDPELPPAVVHVGYVSDAELRALYEGALALIYPSTYEGFGLPPVEAMVCGCPVMTSGQGALAEVAGGANYVVDIGSQSGLAAGLQQVASDSCLRERLSNDGRVRATRFTWRATAETILAQCEEAAEPTVRS